MNIYEHINLIDNKEEFIKFLDLLRNDYINNQKEWENLTVDLFIEAMQSWLEDYEKKDINFQQPNWKTFATILYMGKIYE